MQTIKVRVAKRYTAAVGIEAYELEPDDPAVLLPSYEAGAHIDVHVNNQFTRQYSLCSRDDQANVYRIAVLREEAGRGGSRAMHASVHAGDVITIGHPRNAFALHPDAMPACLLAGGVGITPILAMAYALHSRGRPFQLHYFARSADRAAFREELQQCAFSHDVTFHFDGASASTEAPLDRLIQTVPSESVIYACGPGGFLKRIEELLEQRPEPKPLLRHESFSASGAKAGEKSFAVHFAKSQKWVQVGGSETIAQAAERVGVFIPLSCEQGICGTCVTKVMDGTPDHRDIYLNEEEHERCDQIAPCCSRSFTDSLTLDC